MKRMNIAFFASHGGSNFQAIVESIKSGNIEANASLLISNNSDCYAFERAKALGVPYRHISSAQFDNSDDFNQELLNVLNRFEIDLIVLAGYMRKIPQVIIKKYKNRILNIHPALLPKYGGKGMYGMNVHNAVYEAKESKSGATVHLVSEEYDEGRILKQLEITIEPEDNPEKIAEKVLAVEHILYTETIKDIVNGTIKLD